MSESVSVVVLLIVSTVDPYVPPGQLALVALPPSANRTLSPVCGFEPVPVQVPRAHVMTAFRFPAPPIAMLLVVGAGIQPPWKTAFGFSVSAVKIANVPDV